MVAEPGEGLAGITQYATGLVIHAPVSDAQREAIRRETEREERAAEREEQLRRELAFERRQELLMRGQVPHSHAEVLQSVAVAQDRQDRRDAAAEARNAELFGHGKPHHTTALLAEAKAERKARQAEAESTPASKADVSKLATSLARLKQGVFGATGWKIPL